MSTAKKLLVAGGVLALISLLPAGMLLLMVFALAGGASASDACLEQASSGSAASMVIDAGGPVRLPVVGRFQVMSEFNPGRVDPVDGKVRFHKGLDLAEIPAGGDVVAMKAGTVTRTYVEPWGANTVEIDHGGGITSRYLHLARWTVTPGQQVVVGQQIGIEGSTGHSTGPHVHWEVRVNGQLVNPRDWAKAQGINLPPKGGEGTAPAATTSPAPRVTSAAASVVPAAGPPPPLSGPLGPTIVPSSAPLSTSSSTRPVPDKVGVWTKPQLELALQIIKAGKDKGLDDWTITVGVMTSMGESGLTNINRGDAVRGDTKWSFQQGPEWGPASVRSVPYGAAGLFFAALVKVPDYHSLAPTIAANKTQRNADPYYYAPFWADAVQMVAALAGITPDTAGLAAADPIAAACNATFGTPSSNSATSNGPPPATSTPSASSTTPRPGPVTVPAPPPPPPALCPSTRTPAEDVVKGGAVRVLRCTSAAFPMLEPAVWTNRADTVDLRLNEFRTSTSRQTGWVAARWIQTNATSLGVKTIIFDSKIWTSSRALQGWLPYRGLAFDQDDTIAHRDHIEARTS